MITQLQKIIREDKLSHAYMIEGINKGRLKQEALEIASAILCNDDVCVSRVEQHNHADFYWLETEEQTIKKEMIEEVLHQMNQKPIEGRYKVYIIVDFDKVTPQGENAILKFLEEPPPATIALLLTTKAGDILPTIHSRCQHLSISSEEASDIQSRLENGGIHPTIAATMTALSFDEETAQLWIEEKEFAEVRRAVIRWADVLIRDNQMALIQIPELLQTASAREQQLMIIDLLQLYLQDIMYIKIEKGNHLSYPDQKTNMTAAISSISLVRCIQWIDIVIEGKKKLLQYVNPTLVFEQIAIHIAKEVK